MTGARRLETHPLTRLETGTPLRFHHNGREVEARRGDTVAAALYAAGRAVLSRSMRYHRARGLFCAIGGCTHCFLRIDGQPNRRSCLTPVEPTTWSEDQNAIPNAAFDLLAAADLAFPRYLDAHAAFIRPHFLKPVYTWAIRAMAGFGRVPNAPIERAFRSEILEPDVLVVGGGPAGLAAALEAARVGLRVTLLESRTRLGGRLRYLPTPFHGTRVDAPQIEGKMYAEAQEHELRRRGADLRTGATLFGLYDGVTGLAAATETALLKLHPKRTVIATGALDRYDPFPGSDRAGVLLATAALRLLNEHGIVPPDPVVIHGATREGILLARDLVACGARVAGVFDAAGEPRAPSALVDEARGLGVPVHLHHRPAFVAGRRRPGAVVYDASHDRVRVRCGSLVLATGRVVLGELFQQAGCGLVHEVRRGGFVPRLDDRFETTVPTLYAAGSCAGAEDEWTSVLSGRVAGLAAAASLRPDAVDVASRLRAAQDAYEGPGGSASPAPVEVAA